MIFITFFREMACLSRATLLRYDCILPAIQRLERTHMLVYKRQKTFAEIYGGN